MTATSEANGARPSERHADDSEAKSEDLDGQHGMDDLANGKPKKKRKVVAVPDKKYECPHAGCGKAYSRAEHLYRHQLNHKPKQIYHCDFPGCDRHFVRADLRARHKERHTAKGSHLQRKDAFLHSQTSTTDASSPPSPSGGSVTLSHSPVQINHLFTQPSALETYATAAAPVRRFSSAADTFDGNAMLAYASMSSDSAVTLDPQLSSNGTNGAFASETLATPYNQPIVPPPNITDRRVSYDSSFTSRSASHSSGYGQQQNVTLMQPPPLSSPQSAGPLYTQQPYYSPSSTFRSPTSVSNLPSLPPFGFPTGYGAPGGNRSSSMISPPTVPSGDQLPVPNSRSNSVADFNVIDQMTAGYSMPVFGGELAFNRSPPGPISDDFLASLFSVNGIDMGFVPSPPEPPPIHNPRILNAPLPKLEPDGTPQQEPPPRPLPGPQAIINGLDLSMRESAISEKKRHRLIDLIQTRFYNIDQMPERRSKEAIMAGNMEDPTHVLSLRMLKTYITSYWLHVHQQMPVLHRPTFNCDSCPDLLLLAMMLIGASCLERTHPLELTQNCAELSFFLAYHVRWEVFKDAEFRPTAKLWTFQTLLLLELFEKMYSTRPLHERGHIHHATTLVVMRRGSSLIGRSAMDSPQTGNDPTRTPPGPGGTINTSGQNTPDAFWNRWITAEATRRTAFAAFIIDSTHATLFGHAAVMSPHDIKLPLPCDEALWAATSSAEVQRVEASLAANGFKSTSFIEGLKKTLNGQKVRTNTFGRVILMAGLLNVSWHMNQRDLQVSSLGASSTLGNQAKWRSPLTRAFDFWRRDFDDSLSKNEHWQQMCNPKSNDRTSMDQRDHVFESRTCLHSLAHMAMHVDIIDLQVFAGCERVLGRVVTEQDRAVIQRRMREQWAPSARARDATFYALRFLCEVLIPEQELRTPQSRAKPHEPPKFTYCARDDYLLNRPWVLYFAAMIVWSYGYALDGPIRPSNYTLTSRELQIFDMQRYLIRMGGVASPDDLEKLKDRNSCLGLLLLLRECFRQPRWELLHEASEMLGWCVDMLLPGNNSEVKGVVS